MAADKDDTLSSSFPLSGLMCCPQLFTASSDSILHLPLSRVLFFQSSASPAFLASLLNQYSNISLPLPLVSSCPPHVTLPLSLVVCQHPSFFSSNTQSVNATLSELRAFIVDLGSSNFNFAVICLQESWLNANNDITQIELDHYNSVIQGKTCSSKGGGANDVHPRKIQL